MQRVHAGLDCSHPLHQCAIQQQQQQQQGRLNQWAHWARAHGLQIFFFSRGPQLAAVKYIF